jgi:hypothetical protein
MTEFEFVRWFTKDDYDLLNKVINFNKDKNNTESQLSWLQKNASEVIGLNEMYYTSELERQKQEGILRCQTKKANNKIIDDVKNGEIVKCSCGSNLKWVENYNFVGCSNYRDLSTEHNHPKNYNTSEFYIDDSDYVNPNFKPKICSSYLSIICKIIKKEHNFKIQANNLFEFYILNDVKIYNNDISRDKFFILRESSALSKKREILIKNILEEHNIRFGYQKNIMYKIKGERQGHKIPDFVAVINGVYTIIEQKKNIDNINDSQVEFYKELIQFMHPKALIDIVYVIEEHIRPVTSIDTKYSVFNIEQFKKYLV